MSGVDLYCSGVARMYCELSSFSSFFFLERKQGNKKSRREIKLWERILLDMSFIVCHAEISDRSTGSAMLAGLELMISLDGRSPGRGKEPNSGHDNVCKLHVWQGCG